MYQMAFAFCPLCGKVGIIFVDLDWLLVDTVVSGPCDECMQKQLDEMGIDIPEDVYNRVMGKDDSSNGS